MGGGNPIKRLVKDATNTFAAPFRETARAFGAEGLVNGIQDFQNTGNKLGIGAVDLANNEKGKQKKKADAAQAEADNQSRAEAAKAASAKAAADYSASEADRMGSGSKSRTLLTGPAGLDDEENSISRKTLVGR